MTAASPSKLWLAVLPAMCIPFLASLFYFVLFSEYVFARYLYGATKFFTLFWPLAALWLILREPLPRFSLREKQHYRSIPWGIFLGVAIVALMAVLLATELGEIVIGSTGRIYEKADELGILHHYWSFALFLSIFHSLIEEYYWRWFVYGCLRRLIPGWRAHFFAGLAFASHHVVVASEFFPLFWAFILGAMVGAGGIIWSMLYEKQQTLVGAWVSHILVDLGILGVGYLLLF